MVTFMCQPHGDIRDPDNLVHHYSGCACEGVSGWGEHLKSRGGLSKADCLPLCQWALANPSKAWTEQKGWVRKSPLSLHVFEQGRRSSPAFRLRLGLELIPLTSPTSPVFRFRLGPSCPGSPACWLQILSQSGESTNTETKDHLLLTEKVVASHHVHTGSQSLHSNRVMQRGSDDPYN